MSDEQKRWPALQVKVSVPFKEAVEAAAKQADMTLSDYIRTAVAEKCGYNLTLDDALDGRGRPVKYESDAQRQAAKRQAENERAARRRQLRAAFERKAREEGAQSLEDWLRRKGIPIDDEDVKVPA